MPTARALCSGFSPSKQERAGARTSEGQRENFGSENTIVTSPGVSNIILFDLGQVIRPFYS